MRGLGIPDDIISAEGPGSYAGRNIPMQTFYGALEQKLYPMLDEIDQQILHPLVRLNYGNRRYEIQDVRLSVAQQAQAEEMSQFQLDGPAVDPGMPPVAKPMGGTPEQMSDLWPQDAARYLLNNPGLDPIARRMNNGKAPKRSRKETS
jgi:hypothetical protein